MKPVLQARGEEAGQVERAVDQVGQAARGGQVDLRCHADHVVGVAEAFEHRADEAAGSVEEVAEVGDDQVDQLLGGRRHRRVGDEQVERVPEDVEQRAAEGVADGAAVEDAVALHDEGQRAEDLERGGAR